MKGRRDMKCYKGGNRHKFRPRYEERIAHGVKVNGYFKPNLRKLRKCLFYQVYLYDVCEWCGRIAYRP